ncbi:hypothetical protein JIG36_17190 [Actinoplanes sp. LDG1-06]|uniref:Secreted protein n=1 Tax=Paractinoplanes ovalisporus TaxID=2810368 RepID=A0ABS2ABU7_9ACTN|nr:hypothetical protein [Actinoplanes ovalisporus]MBM2617291.1 hypothetical protein [Actinoplanes ovalisporus]
MFVIKTARRALFSALSILTLTTGVVVSGVSPASAATTCDRKIKPYTWANFKGTVTLKICHNKHFVETVHAAIQNNTGWAVYGTLRIADNQNQAWNSTQFRTDPGVEMGDYWTVNQNWPNGRRACAVFRRDGVMPPALGHACIKVEGGKFKSD